VTNLNKDEKKILDVALLPGQSMKDQDFFHINFFVCGGSRPIYTIKQTVSYNTIFTDRINPIFVVQNFQMLYNTIFTDRINPIFVVQNFQMSYNTIFTDMYISVKLC
jgi:hypothetical protein